MHPYVRATFMTCLLQRKLQTTSSTNSSVYFLESNWEDHRMKRTIFTALSILVFSAAALAQAPTDEIEKALLPAPAGQLHDGATVIKWKADFTYDTLKKGTNKLVCYDRSGQPGQAAFAAECTSTANLERVAQNLKIEAANPDPKAKRAAFEELEKSGKWVKPEYGSVWYHITGQNATS